MTGLKLLAPTLAAMLALDPGASPHRMGKRKPKATKARRLKKKRRQMAKAGRRAAR